MHGNQYIQTTVHLSGYYCTRKSIKLAWDIRDDDEPQPVVIVEGNVEDIGQVDGVHSCLLHVRQRCEDADHLTLDTQTVDLID